MPPPEEEASSPTTDIPGFEELGISGRVLSAIRSLGYETPSPIQVATIPVLLAGRDVVGVAQTGTGKTAAFALPILQGLDIDQRTPQALVLAPTRELALQVCEAFESYATMLDGVHVLPVYGGQGYGAQLAALRRGVHVVVGTPGRVLDHLSKGTLDLSRLRHVVLDEADEMLAMGFVEDVEQILSQTPPDKQTALFSATMPTQIRRLAENYLHDPREIMITPRTAADTNIRQRYLVVSQQQKVDALTRILEVEPFEGVIVFVRTKNETEALAEKLRARGHAAAAINGDVPQPMREQAIGKLREGDIDVLVATDVAARGLDVDRISHVVNFDIPTDGESYVHRIGRTGRAGRTGDAISLITPRERYLLKHLERATRQQPEQMPLPSVEDVNSTRLTRFDDAITTALAETARIEAFRGIIDHYVHHHDVPEADVAAALAIVAQGETPLLLDPDDDPLTPPAQTDAGPRAGRSADAGRHPRRPRGDGHFASYRIEVGRRHRVQPGQIIGALANEGGLGRQDFGAISIRPDHSIVELPADLDRAVVERLRNTRISGRLIELKPDRGAPERGRVHKHGPRDSRTARAGRPFEAPEERARRKPRRKD